MSQRSLRSLASRTVSRAWNDRILGLSAEAAFWQLLSLPSLFLGLLPALLPELFPEGARKTADRVISDAYWPVVLLLLLIGLTSLYHLAPPRRLPWRRGLPGALLAMVIFV